MLRMLAAETCISSRALRVKDAEMSTASTFCRICATARTEEMASMLYTVCAAYCRTSSPAPPTGGRVYRLRPTLSWLAPIGSGTTPVQGQSASPRGPHR